MNDPRFGSRMRGEGIFADQIKNQFALTVKKIGLNRGKYPLSTTEFRRTTTTAQLSLFDG